MKTTRIITLAMLLLPNTMAFSTVRAEQPLQRTDLLKNDIDVAGHEAVQVRVDFAPGVVAPKHSHPGEELAYVLKGTLEYKLEGRPPVTLTAGQSLFIPSGVAHSAKNVGGGKASELATYIVKKGATLVMPAK
ncbi:MAG: cupin domain-containing protein [Rhizobium sp.]|uniref:cupin domain-containing protein n=1 Tax=Rhizobium sp. TaxID=391 RepID=UPI0030F2FA29